MELLSAQSRLWAFQIRRLLAAGRGGALLHVLRHHREASTLPRDRAHERGVDVLFVEVDIGPWWRRFGGRFQPLDNLAFDFWRQLLVKACLVRGPSGVGSLEHGSN